MTREELQQIGEVVDARVKKQLQPVSKRLKKIEHSIELVLNYHDKMYIQQRERIERLEEHTGLTKN